MSFSIATMTRNFALVIPLMTVLASGCSTLKTKEDEPARKPASSCVFDTLFPNWNKELLIYHFYVGQGSSTFIRTPSGKTILIDAGLPGQGETTISPVLKACNITSLDYGMVSHPHIDHFGGWTGILKAGITVGTFYTPTLDNDNTPGKSGEWFDFINNVKKMVPGGFHFPVLGLTSITDKDVKFEILAVNGKTAGDGRGSTSGKGLLNSVNIYKSPGVLKDCNSASTAMVIHYKKFAYFEGGDLTSAGAGDKGGKLPLEENVAAVVKHVDVFHSNHHGSDTSNSEVLLHELSPTYSIVSVGIKGTNGDNTKVLPDGELVDKTRGFHLPNVEALNRMGEYSKAIYMTSKGETASWTADDTKLFGVDILKDPSVTARDKIIINGKNDIRDGTIIPGENDIMLVTDGSKFSILGKFIDASHSGPFNATAN
jgi:competence protein ComEC